MNYEQMYKEALERARSIRFGNPNSATANVVCEDIFPELKESENERLRKRLQSRLDYWAENGSDAAREEISEEKAWLEKQDSQTIKEAFRTEYEKGRADAIAEFEFEKQGKQKPIEEVNGEDYGIDGLWTALDILQKTYGKVQGYQTDDGILEHQCAIAAVKDLYEQKPEWSEEDEKMLGKCIDAASGYYSPEDKQNMKDWLRQLKGRIVLQQLQPKQEL